MQKITPFLWFNGQAEEAVKLYTSVFKNSKIVHESKGPNGAFFSANFQLEGQDFIALNGGPQFTFSPAISLFINCHSQEEVDELWEKLSAGGAQQQCGWLQDRFGISWQVIPSVLGELLHGPDPAKAGRVMQAMMQMTKIDIAKLKAAAEG